MMSEQKGMTIDQAKEKLTKLEDGYTALTQELTDVEKKADSLRSTCFTKLKELTVAQNQFYRGVIELQNKQIADLSKQVSIQKKESPTPVKKSQRRDNVK